MTAIAEPSATLMVDSVSKEFGVAQALKAVSVAFKAHQVHALLGANGSGKSTLVKIMSGAYQPTSGSLIWLGTPRSSMGSPATAAELGIRVVHQEAPLIDNLSVLESVATFRGYGSSGFNRIHWRALRKEVAQLLDRIHVNVRPDELCSRISPSDRAGLALAIAMDQRDDAHETPVKLLILDEVTASIPERETEQHLKRIRQVADSGIAVVMVTHRLGEIRIADDVTILRDGRTAYHQDDGPRLNRTELVNEIVGTAGMTTQTSNGTTSAVRPSTNPVRKIWGLDSVDVPSHTEEGARNGVSSEPALQLENLEGHGLHGLSLAVASGEVVGLVGLEEGGLGTLPRLLSGALMRSGGSIKVAGRPIGPRARPKDYINAGVMTVPSDRLRAGGVATLSVGENIILPKLRRYWHRGALRRSVVENVVEGLDVRPTDPTVLFGALSGGNQQKVLLGKWLLLRPKVLVLDDPTYGVDPGARERIFEAILDAASLGVAVLFLSTEPELLARVSHRVAVVREGVIDMILRDETLTPESLMEASYR